MVLAAIGNMTLAAVPVIYANVHFCAAVFTEKQAGQRVDFPVPVGAFDGCVFQNALYGFKIAAADNRLMHIFCDVPLAPVYIVVMLIPEMLCGLEVDHIAAILLPCENIGQGGFVPLLKSGRINNRLLCELATHKDFIKFLADIEIYVDGIATMQIQNLNALIDTVRHEIIERYRPGEDDPHLKVLQAAHISDDEYFSHMVLDDLSLIIRDIREAHKKDSESAPQTTVADELKENLEAVENFKGSRDEKLVVLYCKQLGINYKNLSDEEFRWLIRILKKSKKMGTPISQRKKR